MTDPTREELEALQASYYAALSAVSSGQSYTVDGLTLTRADIHSIRTQLTQIRRQLIDLDVSEAGGRQGQRVPVWS